LQSPIASRVDTIFIHVRDLEKSVDWYSKLLGIEVKDIIQGPNILSIWDLDALG